MSTVTKPIALDETLQSTNTALGFLGKDTTLQAIATAIANVGLSNIGNMSSLATTDKTSLVSAINEVVGDVSDLDTDKADKVTSATNGNLAGLNASGNLTDSGWDGAKTTTSASGNPISITGLKSNQLAVNPVITFEPIQAGSGDPSPSNVRAISGYDEIEVLSCGKNLWDDGDVIPNNMSQSGNTYTNTNTDTRTSVYLRVQLLDGATVVRSVSIQEGIQTSGRYYKTISVESGEKVTDIRVTHNGASRNIGATYNLPIPITKPCTLMVSANITATNPNTVGGFVMKDIQVELGSSVSTYQTYHKTTDLSEPLPQTVYGGSLDLRTGKLTVDRAIVDLGDYTWTKNTVLSIDRYYTTLTGMKDIPGTSVGDLKCSHFVTDSLSNMNTNLVSNAIVGYGIQIYISTPQNQYADAAAFKTALSSLDVKLVYPLATPFTIQLTPHEISLLKDYAYVSTNGTSIALDYHNGEIATLGDVSQLAETITSFEQPPYRVFEENITSYVNDFYTFAYDGYVTLTSASSTSGKIRANIYSQSGDTFANHDLVVTEAEQRNSIFVKKGMKARVTANTTTTGKVFYRAIAYPTR